MNAVALLLRDVTISHWNTGNKALLFQKSTVDAVNLHCSQNPNQCSLNFWNDSRYSGKSGDIQSKITVGLLLINLVKLFSN